MANEPWWPIIFDNGGCATLKDHPVEMEVGGSTDHHPAILTDHKGRPLSVYPSDLLELRHALMDLAK
jgi:hypothetical protein